jgi:hypothetical protein
VGYQIRQSNGIGNRYVVVSRGTAIYTVINPNLNHYFESSYTVTFDTLKQANNILSNIYKFMGFKTFSDFKDTQSEFSELEIIEV